MIQRKPSSAVQTARRLSAVPLAAVFAALSLLAASPSHAASGVAVVEAWVKQAPPGMKMHAGYVVLKNKTTKPVVLVGASSPQYKKAELHLSKIVNGVATMTKQDQITIPPGGMLAMHPGGFHIMLMHPKVAIKKGQLIDILLKFADDSTLAIKAAVRARTPHPYIN